MASVSEQIVTNQNYSNAMKAQSSQNTTKGSNSVNSQDFLNLLTMQLQYQDPTNPTDNAEMLAQEAQFVTLETMENISKSFNSFSSMYQANSLMGKTVEVTVDGKTTKGTVDYVDYSDSSGASLNIKGVSYPLSSVSKVYPSDSSSSGFSSEDKTFIGQILYSLTNNVSYLAETIGKHFGGGSTEGGDTTGGGATGGDSGSAKS